jgi:hypothetical protein
VVTLTEAGAGRLVQAARLHAEELDRHVYGVLPAEQADAMTESLGRLSAHALDVLPPLG